MKVNSTNTEKSQFDQKSIGLGSYVGISIIRAYRYTFSFLIGRSCRFQPTCSHYTETAIQRFGLWCGIWIGLARILRCNPFGSSGFDPVPEQFSEHIPWYKFWKFGHWTGKHIDPATKLK